MDANDKSLLLAIFKRTAYGRQNARNKQTFTWMLWDTKEPTSAQERTFRLMVESLVNDDGEPICSHPDFGYWYADSLNDADPALADFQSRETALRERRQKLEKNLVAAYGGQMEMRL